jgi:F-type H+-transporting ATPase subunit delta
VIGGGAIAQRYAQALFDLGAEVGEPADLLADLDELVEAATVIPELERVFFTPIHPRAERRSVVAELATRLDHADETRSFAMLLVDENRMSLLPEIRDALRDLVEKAAGRVKAELVSARPLQESEVERVRQALSRRMNALVSVETRVDPSVIGGLVVRVGDLLFDGSLRTQLDSLRGNLKKGSAV